MFVIQRCDEKTLLLIIKFNVKCESDIHSEEWRAYSKLNQNGYQNYTLNYKENYVNPATGKHSQLFECL